MWEHRGVTHILSESGLPRAENIHERKALWIRPRIFIFAAQKNALVTWDIRRKQSCPKEEIGLPSIIANADNQQALRQPTLILKNLYTYNDGGPFGVLALWSEAVPIRNAVWFCRRNLLQNQLHPYNSLRFTLSFWNIAVWRARRQKKKCPRAFEFYPS